MKKILFILVSLGLIFATAGSTATHAQTSKAEKPIELKFSHFVSTVHHMHVNTFTPWVNEVEKRTNGRVKITIYPAQALGQANAHYDMTRTGAVDIGFIVTTYTPGVLPLQDIIGMPFAFPNATLGSKVYWDLTKRGFFDKENARIKMLGSWTTDVYCIHSNKKKIVTVDDIKGVKTRTAGGIITQALESFGAAVVTLPTPEAYTAMQTGVIDAGIMAIASLPDYKLVELSKYVLDLRFGVVPFAIIMNKAVWERLPADVQKVFNDLANQLSQWGGQDYDNAATEAKELLKKAGSEVYSPPDAELLRWKNATRPVWDKWVKDNEAKGLPAEALRNELLATISKFGGAPPFAK